MKIGRFNFSPLDLLLVALPVVVVMEIVHAAPVAIFVTACIAIIPLAGWMGKATEHLAGHYGPGVGGLLNATFGNAAELIIAIMALSKGLTEVVKASITGSIMGNCLLVLGVSMLAGGMRQTRQKFNATAAGLGATLLTLSAIALLAPAAVQHFVKGDLGEALSLEIAVVLFITYALSLVFSLKTHQHLFAAKGSEHAMEEGLWSKRTALIALFVATALIALVSHFLVGAVESTAEAWGMTDVFIGVIIVAVIGNAAEHSSAVIMAVKNKMDLAINIAIGSSIQVALLIAPLLVFLSLFIGPAPMDLVFTPFEVMAVAMSVIVVHQVAQDGESHWMEGVLLLAVYIIVGLAFYFLPEGADVAGP